MDLVVTVPQHFTHPAAPGKHGLAAWIAEGDAAGEPWSGQQWHFTTYGPLPQIVSGERIYIVCEGKLRGYAPLLYCLYDRNRLKKGQTRLSFVRGGNAVAVTINQKIVGFRGYRKRWWDYKDEIPFPDWKEP